MSKKLWLLLLVSLVVLSTIEVRASTHTLVKQSGAREIVACPDSGSSPEDTKQDAITLSAALPSPRHYKYRVIVSYRLYVEAGGLGSYAKAQVSASVGWSKTIDYLSDGAVGGYKDTGTKTWTSPWFSGYGSSVSVSIQLYAEAKLGTGTGVSSHALAKVIISSVTLEVEYPDVVVLEVSGGGTTEPAPGVYEVWGSSFSARAYPDEGWEFKLWLLDGKQYMVILPSVTIGVSSDHTLTAVFVKNDNGSTPPPPPPPPPNPPPSPRKYKLTISVRGQGSTSPSPGVYYYSEGSTVTVRAYPAGGWRFKYWLLDGSRKYSNPITVIMNSDHWLTAVFEKKSSPPPSSHYDYHYCYRVESVSVEVHYSNASGYVLDWRSEKLLPLEYFVVVVKVSVGEHVVRVKNSLNKDRWFYHPCDVSVEFTMPNSFCKYLQKYDPVNPVVVDKPVKKSCVKKGLKKGTIAVKFGVWIIKGVDLKGKWRDYWFTVNYKWSNSYGEKGSGKVDKKIRVCSVKPELYFEPESFDIASIKVYLKWVDDNSYVYGRTYIKLYLNNTQLPEATLDEEGRTLVYSKVPAWELQPEALYAKYTLSDSLDAFTDAVLDTEVEYIELSIVVLERSDNAIKLEVCEFGKNPSIKVKEATVKLICINLESGTTAWTIVKKTDPSGVAVFKRSGNSVEGHVLPEKYELWAVAYAKAVNKIYGNQRYCKILLERKPVAGGG